MDIQAYLGRIAYRGPIEPTAETLRALHVAHLLAVPFENLNIGLGWPIVLEEAALFDKIVVRRRGGFCYELNSLFAALLRELGFDVTLLSAAVAREGGGFGPEFDHMALLVTTDHRPPTTEEPRTENREPRTTNLEEGDKEQRTKNQETSGQDGARDTQPPRGYPTRNTGSAIWLADVGFGDSFREPLQFDEPGEQWQDGRAYRLARAGEHLTLERHEGDGAWEPQYRFTLRPRRQDQFNGMCRYHQTSPRSTFTRRRICTRAAPDGRITLSDLRLIVTHGGVRRERLLADETEYQSVLRDYFGIDLAQMNDER